MAPEELDAIEAVCASMLRHGNENVPALRDVLRTDVPMLVAEVRRLGELVEMTKAYDLQSAVEDRRALLEWKVQAEAECKRLRAALERAAQLCYGHPSLADEIRGLA